MIPLLEANWNRPLIALAIICFTIIACVIVANLHKWFK